MLASFCTAVAAIVIGSRELNFYWYFLGDDVCQRDSSYGWSTMPRTTPVPEETDRIALCIYYTSMLKVSGHGEEQVQIVAGRLRWPVGEGTPSAVGPSPPSLGDCF